MNTAVAQQSFRLTDSLERDLLSSALEQQADARPLQALKVAGRAIARAFNGFFSFVDEVNETMNRARQTSARYSGAQW